MAILDTLLGGGDSSTSLDATVATSPELGLGLSDVLSFDSGDDGFGFTGIGELGLGVSAPTFIGVSASSEQSAGDGGDDGGLLGGLL